MTILSSSGPTTETPRRLYILGLTVLFLGIGFYAAYRKEPCEDGKVCAIPATRRLQRLLLWVATGLMLVLLYFTYVHPNLDEKIFFSRAARANYSRSHREATPLWLLIGAVGRIARKKITQAALCSGL